MSSGRFGVGRTSQGIDALVQPKDERQYQWSRQVGLTACTMAEAKYVDAGASGYEASYSPKSALLLKTKAAQSTGRGGPGSRIGLRALGEHLVTGGDRVDGDVLGVGQPCIDRGEVLQGGVEKALQ